MNARRKIGNVTNIEFTKAVVERFNCPDIILERDYKGDWALYYIGSSIFVIQEFWKLLKTMEDELEAFNKGLNVTEILRPDDFLMPKKSFP